MWVSQSRGDFFKLTAKISHFRFYSCFISVSAIDSESNFQNFFAQEADESLNFEEQILEAAKAITAATVALVKSASAAQKELVASGKVTRGRLSRDQFRGSCICLQKEHG